MKTINDVYPNIPHYNLSENELKYIIDLYFQQVKTDITNLEKPEIAVLWGTLVAKYSKIQKQIKMIDKILENPKPELKEIHLEKYKSKKAKLEEFLKIKETLQVNGKTHRSRKRNEQSQNNTSEH